MRAGECQRSASVNRSRVPFDRVQVDHRIYGHLDETNCVYLSHDLKCCALNSAQNHGDFPIEIAYMHGVR